ncbi:MAG TPA: ImmA/IrrE family metallo-endopeptidase [Herpetosiphonaceae bacterium]
MRWTEFAVREARQTLNNWEKLHGKLQPPIPVEDIADLLYFLAIDTTNDLPSQFAGRLNIEERIIEVRKSDALVRQRFTIAHEVGHYCLHVIAEKLVLNGHGCSGDVISDAQDPSVLFEFETPITNLSTPMISNIKKQEAESRRLEIQANSFAAELLMPASLIEIAVQDLGLNIMPLAERFNVSKQAMQLRLEKLLFLPPAGPQSSFLADL